jgi:hypothetical protein
MHQSYGQVHRVPIEPLTALIEQPGVANLIRKETVESVNFALWRIGVFNQFVQQQTDFNTLHLAEIGDPRTPHARRVVLAESARAISKSLHGDGIGDAGWYQTLKDELGKNITELEPEPTK